MSQPIISVKNISKRYQLGETIRHDTLRDRLADTVKGWLRRPTAQTTDTAQNASEFWALKDVSFDVQPGEVVGIIGRNGAGKSTLLKILSQITEPTSGEIHLRGRIASLLEVGTGFHPELTGRENVFLNGAILGMSQAEIRSKFDEIVDFAGIEKFLDTPVKRYSSGMYVRLAFAVAAHLDPEILIVDEVLAVGDAEFQKKSFARMETLGHQGRTVILVSHNMPTVTSMCSRALLLQGGQLAMVASASTAVKEYLTYGSATSCYIDFRSHKHPPGDKYAQLLSASLMVNGDVPEDEISLLDPVTLVTEYQIKPGNKSPIVPTFDIHSSDGIYAFGCRPPKLCPHEPGAYRFTAEIPSSFLNEGLYHFGITLSSFDQGHKTHCLEKSVLSVNVKDPIEMTRIHGYLGTIAGVVRPEFNTSLKQIT